MHALCPTMQSQKKLIKLSYVQTGSLSPAAIKTAKLPKNLVAFNLLLSLRSIYGNIPRGASCALQDLL